MEKHTEQKQSEKQRSFIVFNSKRKNTRIMKNVTRKELYAVLVVMILLVISSAKAQTLNLSGVLTGIYVADTIKVKNATGTGNDIYHLQFYAHETTIDPTFQLLAPMVIGPKNTVYDCDSSLIPAGPNLVDSFITDIEWFGITLYDSLAGDSLDYFKPEFIAYIRAYHNWYDLHDCPVDSVQVTEVNFSPPGGTDRPPGGTKEIRFTIRIDSGGRTNFQNHYWRRV